MYKRCTVVQRSVQLNCKITKKLYCFKSKDVFAHANIDAVYLTYLEHKKLLDQFISKALVLNLKII